ncbi:MAG: rRNA pseudouridine synthase [Rickettsiales bacterium]|nr:rRNA pseudouridine synthase [Rickettsiales bacterium]
MSEFEGERISKRIARAGICSRREAERLIGRGKVKLNGERIKTPAVNVTDEDEIEVNGRPLEGKAPVKLWMYHKPAGLVTTHSDPEGRPTVFEHLPEDLPPHIISVGRLDLNSEGLLLLTNDGELSRHMEHPETGWLRRYKVRMHGFPDATYLRKLKKGITIDDATYRGIQVQQIEKQGEGKNIWAEVTLSEGKNREIRRVFEHVGCPVSRLIRVSYGPFQLGSLAEGQVKEVPRKVLKNSLGKRFTV